MSTKRLLAFGLTLALVAIPLRETLLLQEAPPPSPQFEPYSWNEDRMKRADGKTVSSFGVKFQNYVDRNGTWKNIDVSTRATATGFVMDQAPYAAFLPTLANGNIKFSSTNRFQISTQSIRNDDPVESIHKFTDAIAVPGVAVENGVLYSGAFPTIGADLLVEFNANELRQLVVWNTAPPACTTMEIPFTRKFSHSLAPKKRDGTTVRGTDETLSGFKVELNSFRGVYTKPARIWDSHPIDRKVAEVPIVGRWNPALFNAKKVIDCAFFTGATYPVYTDDTSSFFPDPHVEVTTVDGATIQDGTNVVWSTFRTQTASSAVDSTTPNNIYRIRASTTTDQFDRSGRGYFAFDTGPTLPDNATIDSGSLILTGGGAGDTTLALTFTIAKRVLTSATAVATGDHDISGWTLTEYATTRINNKTTAPIWITDNENTFILNEAGKSNISLTGITYFSSLTGQEFDNSPPTWGSNQEGVALALMAEDGAGTTNDPELKVVWSTPAAATPTPSLGMTFFFF